MKQLVNTKELYTRPQLSQVHTVAQGGRTPPYFFICHYFLCNLLQACMLQSLSGTHWGMQSFSGIHLGYAIFFRFILQLLVV